MNPAILWLGGLGILIFAVALLDDGPVLPEDASPELVEWQEFLRAHRELRV